MRTFVTLDPEYLPWAPDTPNVKLRKKHNRLLEAVIPIIAIVVVMGGIWLYVNRGTLTQGDGVAAAPTVVAAALPGAPVVTRESVTRTDSLSAAAPTMGQFGAITLLLKRDKQFTLYCQEYRLIVGNETIRQGNTMTTSRLIINHELVYARGAMIDASAYNPKKIKVICDGKTVQVVY